MKVREKFAMLAKVHSILHFFEWEEIGKRAAKELCGSPEFDVDRSGDGLLVFRIESNAPVSDRDVCDAICSAMEGCFREKSDEVSDYLQDNYEIDPELGRMNGRFIQTVTEIDRDGRIISVEFDIE